MSIEAENTDALTATDKLNGLTIRQLVGRTRKYAISPEHFRKRAIQNAAEALALVWTLEEDNTRQVLEKAREFKAERYDPEGMRLYSPHEELVVLQSTLAFILWGRVERMDGADDLDPPMHAMRGDLDALARELYLGPQATAHEILEAAFDKVVEAKERTRAVPGTAP